jgi:hypothetical protein
MLIQYVSLLPYLRCNCDRPARQQTAIAVPVSDKIDIGRNLRIALYQCTHGRGEARSQSAGCQHGGFCLGHDLSLEHKAPIAAHGCATMSTASYNRLQGAAGIWAVWWCSPCSRSASNAVALSDTTAMRPVHADSMNLSNIGHGAVALCKVTECAFFFIRQLEVEMIVIVIDDFLQGCKPAIVIEAALVDLLCIP